MVRVANLIGCMLIVLSSTQSFSEWYWGVGTGLFTGMVIPWCIKQGDYQGVKYAAISCSSTVAIKLTKFTANPGEYHAYATDALGCDLIAGWCSAIVLAFLRAKKQGMSACIIQEALSCCIIRYICAGAAADIFHIKKSGY